MTIELRDVSYTYAGKYQRVTAVDTVSYTFQSGTMYSIMGASGSGKSTLLSLLAGLKLPTEGEIAFDEQPTCFMDRSALRRDTVSVIYQDFNLFPLLTAEENVCYPLRLRKEDKDQALALARQRLADMGIRESYFRKLPNQLSGGEQQRVAIARALAAGSYVILADEPTGNLDSGNSRMIVETLQRLAHQEKRCVIVVTHDPAVAAAADVQLRMQDGRLTQEEQQAEA
ncbi:MAG: ABC transporter ATP-binding protein [Oscillospiraceae bacterium]|nr:ABC transporter ATP-binding protein [Oscillospiraceae bacterium]